MIITCSREQLLEAVLNVQRAVSSKSSIPALQGILLKAKQNSIFLCGYDAEMLGMTTEIEAEVTQTGTIVLSAKLFGDIVRRLPDERVHMETDDKNMTTIRSGQSNFSIVGIPAEEYPELPTVSGERGIRISNLVLKNMIHQTIFAVAESDAKPIHTGTLFEIGSGKIRLVSVDGYRLAMREEMVNSDEQGLSFVVPGKALQEVSKLLPENDENCELQIGSRHILFIVGRYTVIARLLEGEFLDYRSAIPQKSSSTVILKTSEFISSVERVSLLITDRLKSPIRCIFDEDTVRLSSYTPIGRASDQFPAKLVGNPVEMGFNNHYLLDALRNAEGDQIKLELNGSLSPMKVLPMEGNSFLFLVLPVRLKSEAG
ncbi:MULTISPECIES: DNA polymerase III subunit beta [Caproicibacterium]|uniref:Beta sliding clamp n=1 Tax=Caproicibacterium argilliputei TaxID=3030016 RepID=A0AA97D8I9_9FIRM|nr:DNA polymerase III subunit beta [Caproicibacterium argilliputei]WOC32284.1 DNA polymerase III subunit beta [Caproicibacterium argilliputei]